MSTSTNAQFLIGRRRFLRGAGGITVALPFLPSLAPRVAFGAAPKRVIFWFQPDGSMDAKSYGSEPFWPSGTGESFTLAEHTKPLEPVKGDIIFLRGIHNLASAKSNADSVHGSLLHSMLTGTGPDSIDQVIADKVSGGRSLQLGVATERSGRSDTRMSYRGGSYVAPAANPFTVYAELFGGKPSGSGSPGTPTTPGENLLYRVAKTRKSVLDAVHADLKDLSGKVSSADKQRLEQHADAIRKVEGALVDLDDLQGGKTGSPVLTPVSSSCNPPKLDTRGLTESQNFTETVVGMNKIAAVQQDLMMLALHCGKHKVATMMFMRGRDDSQAYEFLNITAKDKGQHGFAHMWDTDKIPTGKPDYAAIHKWRAELFRDLVLDLKRRDDGDGTTMFDNTLLIWMSEMGDGKAHDPKNMTMVMAGKAGRNLKTGRSLQFNEPHTNALISVAQMMDVPLTKFGADGTRPLSGL